ncbi:MAG: hypothetical protein IPO23_02310 [Flavobacterium sp.]|nr:hypothetical protein [Flavobacterium sp.]
MGSRAAQLSIANDDSNENPYLINLTGTGTTSQQSTISAATFTAPTNVAYGSYQAGNITFANSLEVGQFTVQDGVSDNDSFGTTLSTITFSLSNSANVQRVALYDGATELQEIAAGATNVFNAGLGAINTTDGGSKTFSIRVTFNPTVTDNQQYQFTATSATADAAGSGFATVGGSTSIAGNNNRIVVTANRLSFGTVGGGSINVTLPSFTLSATDGLGNVDLDRSAAVTLGTTSAFPSANFTRTTPTYALTGGSITISNVAFADAQTTTLTADAAGLTQGVSNPFIISLVSFPANSYRTTSAGAYPSGATWERFVSGTWTSGFTPVAGEDDFIYIRHAITNASNSPQNVVIETGGTFTYNSSATNLSSLLVESGGVLQINAALTVSGTFTVESGGTVNINSSTTNGASALWNGVEDFQDGSTVNIQNWQYADANRLIENPSRIQVNTTSGSYFGNLIVSGNPPTGDSFIVVDGAPTINLCKNNFTVSEAGTGYVAITSSGANATIGGNVIVTTGQFNVAATTSGNAITTVLGNISVASGGTLNLNVNSSGSATSIVQLKGNLSVVSGGTLNSTDAGCAVVFSGTTGTQTLSLAGTLGTNANFEVGDGTNASTVQLINQNLNLTNSSNAFTVKTNGILDFNYRDITGIGTFTLESAGELRITSAAGLTASGATGNVTSSGTRTISQSGIFRYTGNVTPQATGNAMTTGSSAKRIIIDKTNPTDVVNLTQSTGTTDRLEIIEGTFVETAAANVSGSGNLVMSGGTYRTAVVSGPVPLLAGTFTLTGGTIDLNAAGNQTLKGARDYRNLTFSTSGTKTLSSAPDSVTGTATVQSGVILDVDNNSFGGSITNLTLNGTAIYKTSGNGTKPDADGTYNLAATSTVEFYGTSATIVKLGSPAVSYGNVVVSGTNVSSTSTTTGILFKSGGSFTVKQGATFTFRQPGGLNGLVNSAVSSTNSPTVTIENTPALSTIVYNGVGQSLTGRADYGNLIINNTSGALNNKW